MITKILKKAILGLLLAGLVAFGRPFAGFGQEASGTPAPGGTSSAQASESHAAGPQAAPSASAPSQQAPSSPGESSVAPPEGGSNPQEPSAQPPEANQGSENPPSAVSSQPPGGGTSNPSEAAATQTPAGGAEQAASSSQPVQGESPPNPPAAEGVQPSPGEVKPPAPGGMASPTETVSPPAPAPAEPQAPSAPAAVGSTSLAQPPVQTEEPKQQPAGEKPAETKPAPTEPKPVASQPSSAFPPPFALPGAPFPGPGPMPEIPAGPAGSTQPPAMAPVGPPAAAASASARAQGSAAPAEDERRIVFNFKFQPWGKVLEWLAEQAGLSLVMEGPPHGTFNYSDRRAYTVAEAIDLVNSVLLTKGYVLVRRGQMLILVNLQDGVPPNLVPIVPESELDKRGEHELVSTVFSLSRLSVDEAQQEIRSLLGPQGSVVVLPKAQQLLVTDTAGRLRMIRDVLMRADSPEGGIIEALQIFTLKHITPDEAIAVLRQLLGIPADQFITPDGSLRLAVDTVGMRIFAAGRSPRVRQVADILQAIDIPGPGGSSRGAEGTLQLEVYEVAPADPQTVLQVMQTLLAGSPGVRLTTDSKTGNLVALARPSEHATIRATLEQLRQQGTRLEVIPLRRLDPQVAATAITKLLASQDGSSAVKVEVDSLSRQLLVRGTERDLMLVRSLLEKMGEGAGGGQSPSQAGTVRVLPIYGTQARQVIERLQQIWPTLRGNTLRVVGTPSFIQSRTPADNVTAPALQGAPLPGQVLGPAGAIQPYPGWGPTRSAEEERNWPEVDLRQEGPPPGGPPPDRGPKPEVGPAELQPQPVVPGEIQSWPIGPPIELQAPPPDAPLMPAPPPAEEPTAGVNWRGEGRSFELVWRADLRDSALGEVRNSGIQFASFQGAPAPSSQEAPPVQSGGTPPSASPAANAPSGPAASAQEENQPAANSSEESRPPAQPAPTAPVVIAPGPSGLVIASEDQEALDLLEELVRMISSQVGSGPQLTIFYLKHARADAVAEVLDQVFGGGTMGGTASSGGGGSMVRDLATAAFGEIGGGIVSSLIGGGGTITPSGTLRITPDTRLNALIVQATPTDLEIIEQLLQVLDQKESPEEVLAQPRPRVVPVRNMQASEVAEIVRQVYQDRLVSSSGQQMRGGPPNPQEFIQMLQAIRGGRGGSTSRRGTPEQMQRLSIGVDSRTNSVIVVAPEPLFQEVKQLIEELDAAAAKPPQATQVVVVKKANPEALQQAVRAMLGDSVTIGRSTPGATSSTSSTSGSGRSSGGFDRSRFSGSGGGGGPPGFGFPPGGPGFFGRGFFGGFGQQGGGFSPPSGSSSSGQSGRSGRSFGGRSFGR